MTGRRPVIVRGRPNDVELAALTAVLAALSRPASAAWQPTEIQPRPSWPRPAEFVFGNSWVRRPTGPGASQFQVHLEDPSQEWGHRGSS